MIELNFHSIWIPIIITIICGILFIIAFYSDEWIGCILSPLAVFLIMASWLVWALIK